MLHYASKNWEAPTHTGGANICGRGPKCQTPGPGSQIGAVCPRKKEVRDIHSFNIRPKAPHGSQKQCCNMCSRIGMHQNILEEQTYFKEVKSAKPGPGSQIGAVCPREKDVKAIHSFNICPKASIAGYRAATHRPAPAALRIT